MTTPAFDESCQKLIMIDTEIMRGSRVVLFSSSTTFMTHHPDNDNDLLNHDRIVTRSHNVYDEMIIAVFP